MPDLKHSTYNDSDNDHDIDNDDNDNFHDGGWWSWL